MKKTNLMQLAVFSYSRDKDIKIFLNFKNLSDEEGLDADYRYQNHEKEKKANCFLILILP